MNNPLDLLQREYRRIRRNVLCFVIYIVLCCLCLFWNTTVALLLLGVAVGIQWFVLRRQQKQYTRHITEQNLLQTTCKQLGATTVDNNGGGSLTAEIITHAKLMPLDDSKYGCLLRMGIEGRSKQLAVQLCDATLAQTFRLSAKGKRRIHYNAGVWVHIELPQDSGGDWRLLDETSVPTPIRMAYFAERLLMTTAPLSDSALAKRMVLYHPVDQPDQQPAPSTLRQISRLVTYTTGYVAVSLQGQSLDIFLRGRFLARPVSLSHCPTAGQLDFDPLPELAYCIDLAKAIAKLQPNAAVQPTDA